MFASIKPCVLPGISLGVYGIPPVPYAILLYSVNRKPLHMEPVNNTRCHRESHATDAVHAIRQVERYLGDFVVQLAFI